MPNSAARLRRARGRDRTLRRGGHGSTEIAPRDEMEPADHPAPAIATLSGAVRLETLVMASRLDSLVDLLPAGYVARGGGNSRPLGGVPFGKDKRKG